jgi:hypothetical protein
LGGICHQATPTKYHCSYFLDKRRQWLARLSKSNKSSLGFSHNNYHHNGWFSLLVQTLKGMAPQTALTRINVCV